MANSVSCGPAWLMDGPTYDGVILRTNHVAASFFNTGNAAVRGGVMPSGGAMAVSAGSGMSVNVATGYALCPASAGTTSGGYLMALMAAANLTVATSDATNPRIDRVCAFAQDNGDATSAAFVEVLTGTAAAGATLSNLDGAPALPSNGIALAYVLVPANSTSVASGNILDQRGVTVAQGGILPTALAFAPAGYTGNYIHDYTSGTLKHNPASGPVQTRVLPFTPQLDFVAIPEKFRGNAITVASVTVTCDGNTDLEIYFGCGSQSNNLAGPGEASWDLNIDSTTVWQWASVMIDYTVTSSAYGAGVSFTHHTRSGVDRPTAGTHTISVSYQDTLGGTNPTTLGECQLYVRPAPL